MHVTSSLQVREDIVLQLRNRLQLVRRVLILLDVPNDLGRFSALVEIDQIRRRVRGNAILDEGQIRKIDACNAVSPTTNTVRGRGELPKKGMQGAFAA